MKFPGLRFFDMTDAEIAFTCCFCQREQEDDPITLVAEWEEDGDEYWQAWGAHRACLVAALGDEARNAGGPLMGAE